MKQSNFLRVYINLQKLKSDWKFFGWAWSKMGADDLVSGLWNLLYLQNEQMELIDFLHAFTNSRKLKGDWKFLGWAWSKVVWSVWW